mgnify:CR=1 FL=1
MKFTLVFLLLFVLTGWVKGQDELVVLKNEPIEFEADGFYIKKVTDGRSDKESIGFIQKGVFKKKKIQANFKDGLEKALFNYLDKSLIQDKNAVPVIVKVTHLHISESKDLPVKGKAEVKMEFYREKEGSIGRLYEAEAFVEKPAVNVSKTHEERIRSVINTCLKSFNESDWKSITPVYFQERS